MLSLDGEVLGVITAGGGENIAFGIPPQLVRRVVPDLIEFGDYQHPFLGVSVQDVTPPVARANGLSAVRGVAVTRVVEDGPVDGVLRPNADTARVGGTVVPTGGDVVVAVGDTRVNDLGDLLIHLAFRTFPGDEVTLGVVREGTERTVTATVGVRPV
jgi:S1-C subfamily serine protease